jgi:hypothetical protein
MSFNGGRRTEEERLEPKCNGEEDFATGDLLDNDPKAIRLNSSPEGQRPYMQCYDVMSLKEWMDQSVTYNDVAFGRRLKWTHPLTRAPITPEQLIKINRKLFKIGAQPILGSPGIPRANIIENNIEFDRTYNFLNNVPLPNNWRASCLSY